MPTQALPEANEIRNILEDLLGRNVTVAKVTPESIDLTRKVVVGVYQRKENGSIGGVVVADLEVAVFGGAALALLPLGVAKENISDGVIDEGLLENFHEVLNIGARWFTAKGNPHIALAEVFDPAGKVPDDVRQVMATPSDRLEAEVTIAGYGSGRIRLLVTDF